ncbi:MAG: FAD-dependent oxidoreductase [Candidatus Omnitrophota bacterium]
MYDLIIIGAGPAGITAAVYAARKRMQCLVISQDVGGQAAWSGDIENYTGYQFISGPDLVAKFEEHLHKYSIELKETEEVLEIKQSGKFFNLRTNKGSYQSKVVIIASGKRSKELGVPGEKELKNKGLTYCATCDGPLFSGKDVAVIGGGNSCLDAALQLERIAKKIYIINNTPNLGGDSIMREKVMEALNITVFNNSKVLEVLGEKFVTGVRINVAGEKKDLSITGIFVEIGLKPNSDFTPVLDKNEAGEIKVNCKNETNIPGIFACGDVTSVEGKQIIIAAGEGAKASLSAFRYLATQK